MVGSVGGAALVSSTVRGGPKDTVNGSLDAVIPKQRLVSLFQG